MKKSAGSFILEQEKNIPVAAEADVVVLGGGIAGISAALSAARGGASVIIIEKQCLLGGLATVGLVILYLPLCDGYGRQLVGGIGEELLHICYNAGTLRRPDTKKEPLHFIPECWNNNGNVEERKKFRFQVCYDAAPAELALEKLLLNENKIEIWYDTAVCGCQKSNNMITHVITENKSGRLAIKGKSFVDASGDADLCFYAGEETVTGNQNQLSGWYFGADLLENKIELHPDSEPIFNKANTGQRFYTGGSGKEVSQNLIDTHRYIIRNSKGSERKGEIPFLIPAMPLLRMTRRLNAVHNIAVQDIGVWKEDTLGMTGDWRKPALGYCVTLSSLHGKKTGNLFAAGRCMGCEGDAWDVLRVIPPCAVTGEAAGLAASEIALGGVSSAGELDSRRLASKLIERKVIINPELLKL
jgi:hypothetical protein